MLVEQVTPEDIKYQQHMEQWLLFDRGMSSLLGRELAWKLLVHNMFLLHMVCLLILQQHKKIQQDI